MYILAEKLGCEQLQNLLMDALVKWWRKKTPKLPLAAIVVMRWPAYCALARLYIDLIGYNMAHKGFDKYITDSASNAEDIHEWIEAGGPVVHKVFCIVTDKAKLVHPCTGDVCKWHVHQRTPYCKGSAKATNASNAKEVENAAKE